MTVAALAAQHSVIQGACKQSGTSADNVVVNRTILTTSGMVFDPSMLVMNLNIILK